MKKYFVFIHHVYIVACQRRGVSDEPPWLRAATRHGSTGYTIFCDHVSDVQYESRLCTGPVLLRQSEPSTSQYFTVWLCHSFSDLLSMCAILCCVIEFHQSDTSVCYVSLPCLKTLPNNNNTYTICI